MPGAPKAFQGQTEGRRLTWGDCPGPARPQPSLRCGEGWPSHPECPAGFSLSFAHVCQAPGNPARLHGGVLLLPLKKKSVFLEAVPADAGLPARVFPGGDPLGLVCFQRKSLPLRSPVPWHRHREAALSLGLAVLGFPETRDFPSLAARPWWRVPVRDAKVLARRCLTPGPLGGLRRGKGVCLLSAGGGGVSTSPEPPPGDTLSTERGGP